MDCQKTLSVSAIYVFGDSVVDSGNNDYINTIARCDLHPYGKDFPDHVPTGRFTNGKLITDFIASYIGVKELVPPYLDKSLGMEELITGVCFASGGSGEYKSKLESTLGKDIAENHIQRALFIVCAGSNDFALTYLTLPSIRKLFYTVEQNQHFVLEKAQEFLQDLWKLGARRIGVLGTLPICCWPITITLKKRIFLKDGCVGSYTKVATDFNEMLGKKLEVMQKKYENLGGRIAFGDIYTTSLDLIHNPYNYGFEKTDIGCCGTGLIEFSYSCNNFSSVCPNTSKYVFGILFTQLRGHTTSSSKPSSTPLTS